MLKVCSEFGKAFTTELTEQTYPEILRSNLGVVVLRQIIGNFTDFAAQFATDLVVLLSNELGGVDLEEIGH